MSEKSDQYDWKEILEHDLNSPDFGYILPATEAAAQLWVSSSVYALLTNSSNAVNNFINHFAGTEGLETTLKLAALIDMQPREAGDFPIEEREAIEQGIRAASSTEHGESLFWSKYYDIWDNGTSVKVIKSHMNLRQSLHEGQAILIAPLPTIGEKKGLPTRILYKEKEINNYADRKPFDELIGIMERAGFSGDTIRKKLANSQVQKLLYATVGPDVVDDVMRAHNVPVLAEDVTYFSDHPDEVISWVYEAVSEEMKQLIAKPVNEFLMTDVSVPMSFEGQQARMSIRLSIGRKTVYFDPARRTMVGDFSQTERASFTTEVYPDLTLETTEKSLLQLRQQGLDFVELTGLADHPKGPFSRAGGGGGLISNARLMRMMFR